jgi:hypothetical protein
MTDFGLGDSISVNNPESLVVIFEFLVGSRVEPELGLTPRPLSSTATIANP